MRWVVLAGVVALAGCSDQQMEDIFAPGQRAAREQTYREGLAFRAAERCARIGISTSHPEFQTCGRQAMAAIEQEERAADRRAALSRPQPQRVLPEFAPVPFTPVPPLPVQQPQRFQTNCVRYGNILSCN